MGTIWDKAEYHYDGDWPEGLPQEQAYVHAGLFLGWLVERDLVSDFFREESEEAIAQFRARSLTGPQLYESWDGALTDDMLSDEGNAFAADYFDISDGAYVTEYEQLLADGLESIYHVADTWENYDRLRAHLDRRFADWRADRAGDAFLAAFAPTVAADGWMWSEGSRQLDRGGSDPRTFADFAFAGGPGELRISLRAQVSFRDVEIVAARAEGDDLREAKRYARTSATASRRVGTWTSRDPGFEDVKVAVREALAGPVRTFHDEASTREAVSSLFEAFLAGQDTVDVGTTPHYAVRHVALQYVSRRGGAFNDAVDAWRARLPLHREAITDAAGFLYDHWDAPLTRE